ncbi:MAG: 50S ribosomal protein L21 [Deferribacterales bacterium]|nr:50S ribosomal protein L21 [Deferribacterales bacterium]
MFAIIKTGGKQYTVKEGDVFNVEKIQAQAGENYTFNEVLLVSDDNTPKVGSPFVKDASVEVEVIAHGKADRVYIFKKKSRKDYRKRQGHRQQFTKVKVTKIVG